MVKKREHWKKDSRHEINTIEATMLFALQSLTIIIVVVIIIINIIIAE